MQTSFKKLFVIYAIIVILNIIAFTLLYPLFPKLRYLLFAEDMLIEDITALFFLMSFIFGSVFILRLKEKKERKIYLVLPLFGLIGFIEELDWGERIFHFKAFYIYGIKFNALHDINMLLHKKLTEQSGSLLYILAAICLLISAIIFLKYRNYFLRIPEFLRKYPSFGLIIIASSFLLTAQVYDFELVKPMFFEALEEILEMNGAFTWLFASFLIGYGRLSNKAQEQSADRFEKKIPVLAGMISVAFFLFGSASYFVLSAHTKKLTLESREYVDKIVPLIFSSWDTEAMLNNMPSDFSSEAFKTNAEISFASYKKKMSGLIDHKIVGYNLKFVKRIDYQTPETAEKITSFRYVVKAKFQKGHINLHIRIVHLDNKWHLYYLELKQ